MASILFLVTRHIGCRSDTNWMILGDRDIIRFHIGLQKKKAAGLERQRINYGKQRSQRDREKETGTEKAETDPQDVFHGLSFSESLFVLVFDRTTEKI